MISVDSGATGKLLCSLFQGATCFLEEQQQWKAVEVPGWTSLRQTRPQLLTLMKTRYPTRPVILVELLHLEISISDISLSCIPPLCIRIGILTPERLNYKTLIYSHHLSGICFIPADEVFVLVIRFLWIPYFLSFISTCGSCPAFIPSPTSPADSSLDPGALSFLFTIFTTGNTLNHSKCPECRNSRLVFTPHSRLLCNLPPDK